GGVATGADALLKIKAGASLIQLYTAMVFDGPGIAMTIKQELATLVENEGFSSVSQLVGSDAEALQDFGLSS
ncbi:MAG: dihydroorotate dehydrogenase (quinone), partial [Rhizobiales bacterium]|nr:dihydroorotate dehydrogenase (quinone) [Hyphomicrobiales bacterium]